MASTAALDETIGIVELYEYILFFLDARDLFHAAQTNTRTRSIILKSPSLREKLFLNVPSWDSSKHTNPLTLNPFFAISSRGTQIYPHGAANDANQPPPFTYLLERYWITPPEATFHVGLKVNAADVPKRLEEWEARLDHSMLADTYFTSPALPCTIEVRCRITHTYDETELRPGKLYELHFQHTVVVHLCTLRQKFQVAKHLVLECVYDRKTLLEQFFRSRATVLRNQESPGKLLSTGDEAEEVVGMMMTQPKYDVRIVVAPMW